MSDHLIEAEQSLLGAILVNNEAMRFASPIVEYQHFYEPVHQHIFDICQSLIELGKVVTPVTVLPFLPKDIEIAQGMTLAQYVARLASEATTIINTADYAQIVRDYADMRTMVATLQKMQESQHPDPDRAGADTIEVIDTILSARTINHSAKAVTMNAAVVRAIDAAATAYKYDGAVNGLATGLRDLDWKLGGFQNDDLIFMAGRPGMGKSGVAVSMALNFAASARMQTDEEKDRGDRLQPRPGVIFTLEMDEVQITQRMLSDLCERAKTKVPYNLMRTGNFTEQQFMALRDAAYKLEKLPINFETKARISVAELSARARRWKRRGLLDWMVVDYLQLMTGAKQYQGNRVQEISDMTMSLKALAKELHIPLLVLSQLSRDVEKREDKRPHLSDLRDSGSIEQDADVVLFLYREEYYLLNAEPRPGTPEHEMWQNRMTDAANKLEVIIGKNRAGPTGSVPIYCDIGNNAFRNLVEEDYLPSQHALAL